MHTHANLECFICYFVFMQDFNGLGLDVGRVVLFSLGGIIATHL